MPAIRRHRLIKRANKKVSGALYAYLLVSAGHWHRHYPGFTSPQPTCSLAANLWTRSHQNNCNFVTEALVLRPILEDRGRIRVYLYLGARRQN